MAFLVLLPIVVVLAIFAFGLLVMAVAVSLFGVYIKFNKGKGLEFERKTPKEETAYAKAIKRLSNRVFWSRLGRFIVASYLVGMILIPLFMIATAYDQRGSGFEILVWLLSPFSLVMSLLSAGFERAGMDAMGCSTRFGCFEAPTYYLPHFILSLIATRVWIRKAERTDLKETHA